MIFSVSRLSLLVWILALSWSYAASLPDSATSSIQNFSIQNEVQRDASSPASNPSTPPPTITVAPPGTGTSPALQGANTPFRVRRFKVSLSENDLVFSDKGLSQYLEFLYTSPLDDTLALNAALKFEMITPARKRYFSPDGEELCCNSGGTYHYPLYLEGQVVKQVPLSSSLHLRLSGQVQAGIDAPDKIGGPLHNAWHDLFGFPHFDAVGESALYGGVGGSVLLEGASGHTRYFFGPSVDFTTLERALGVVGGLEYRSGPFALQTFATSERVNSQYFTADFQNGYRVMTGLSAALRLNGAKLGSWTPILGFSVLYDYNSVAPDLSNIRYTFIPDVQLSIPVR